jgi:Domain of unknown function (DUF2019)
VRAAAADTTRTLASELSRDRLFAIDEADWSPPDEVPGLSKAELDALFPQRRPRAKSDKLKEMSVEQLVERFLSLALQRDDALLGYELAKVNRLFMLKIAVFEELKSRAGDQRRALVPLYDHPNPQVQLDAAKSTLAVAPQEARAALQALADSQKFPQAGDAGMSLRNLDRGVFKPT